MFNLILDNTIDREEFFKAFCITEEYFSSTGLNWDELMKIYADYIKLVPYLEKESEHIVSKLIDSEGDN